MFVWSEQDVVGLNLNLIEPYIFIERNPVLHTFSRSFMYDLGVKLGRRIDTCMEHSVGPSCVATGTSIVIVI